MELASIDGGAAKWAKAVEIATLAERLGFDSVWVYDHFHNVPRPAHEAVFECWTTVAAISQLTNTDAPRPDGRLRQLSQPGAARQDHVDRRRHLRRSPRLGHRCRLVRAGVPGLRLRLPAPGRAHRRARRHRRDRQADVDGARCHLPRALLLDRRSAVRPQAGAATAPADLDRRSRRAARRCASSPEHADYSNFGGDQAMWAHKRDVFAVALRQPSAATRRRSG